MSAGRILAAVAALALLAGAVWRRRKLGIERTAIALMLAAGLAIYASGLLSELPDPEKLIEDLAKTLGDWTYALVGVLAFLETGAFVGLIAPGEFTVILGGVIAGQGEINVIALLGLTWFAAFMGDSTSFAIGRKLGREFLERHGPKVKITAERLEQVEGYFARHGGKTILIGRFIGLVRALAPFVAGSSKMRYRRFAPYSVVGTGLWAATFVLLGFFFWRSFEQVASIAGRATIAFGIVVGAIVAVVYAYRRLRHEEERERLAAWLERQGRRPVLRPLAFALRPLWRRALRPAWRFAAPQLRFLWQRLTPGDLGIELTTTVAAVSVGGFVYGAYADELHADPGVTPADEELLDLADRLRAELVVDIATVVTELGALYVVLPLVLVGAVFLAWRRLPLESATLVGGLGLIYLVVHSSKAWIDRPRPAGGLVETEGSSFPSGHAAYATAFVALAVLGARAVPGVAGKVGVVVAAVAVTAVVGLSRIYLRAHYWSDVAAGWGLGFALFAALGAIALLVSYIRQNGPGRGSRPVQSGRD